MGKTKASWAPGWERPMPGAGRPAGAWEGGPARQGSLRAGFPGQGSRGSLAPQGPTTRPPAWPPRAPGRAGPRRKPLLVTSFLVSKATGPSPRPLQERLGDLRHCTPKPKGSPESHVLSVWTPHKHPGQHLTTPSRGKWELPCSPHFAGKETSQRADVTTPFHWAVAARGPPPFYLPLLGGCLHSPGTPQPPDVGVQA